MLRGPHPGRDSARGASEEHGHRSPAPRLHMHGSRRGLLPCHRGDGQRRGLGADCRRRHGERLRGPVPRNDTPFASGTVSGRGGHGSAGVNDMSFTRPAVCVKGQRAVPNTRSGCASPWCESARPRLLPQPGGASLFAEHHELLTPPLPAPQHRPTRRGGRGGRLSRSDAAAQPVPVERRRSGAAGAGQRLRGGVRARALPTSRKARPS